MLKRLRITRPTLTRYVKEYDGKIKVELLPNGQDNTEIVVINRVENNQEKELYEDLMSVI